MGTFISVTLGVAAGIMLSMIVMFIIMLNPKLMTWCITKYMNALEKSMKNFEEKIDV